ncbi:hypothetical protein [Cellvibrio sp. KY-YJ-3]|jgi:hypothetical protein|uniref:hypothetical protein n=1 Tax=Cellvibrio sp. KY-YJ-3 TaxID=454662 RepID=UPI0012490EF6|nr:hypothetical protein [Cellvibrio sp. KY-YJ-3]QEY12638.1 hypothetical protein D0B88_10490 [Cellvibrio sp. KY-YJ-3]
MNDFFSITKKQLSLQIEMLIFSCIQTSFSIGSSLIACTTTHFDSRTGMLAITVMPHGANPDLFDGRISLIVTCDTDSRDKLIAVNSYLLAVLNNGYSKFTGFPDQPKTVSAARTHSIQSRAHAPSELVKGTCDRAQAVSRS